jgi:uncharacterized protein YcaQ
MVVELTARDARRIAVRAQLLDAQRPGDVVEVAEQLGVINIDPTAAVAPSEDLLLWSRIGEPYDPGQLKRAAEVDRTIFELNGMFRPVSDLELLLPQMRQPPRYAQTRQWLEQNDRFRRDVLERLAESGPLLSGEIPDTSQVSWPSTGWNNDRNVTMMLEILAMRGQVAISGREKRQRYWDLPERVYPPGLPELSLDDARRERDARRLRALGIARAKSTKMPDEPIDVGDGGVEAVVEGVKGEWRVDREALDQLSEPFEGRTALLSPFDRLVFDRKRLLELFDYEYILEMYKPKAARRWGYFALPILHGDRFVGKLDAATDRKAEVLRVAAIHEDIPFSRDVAAAVDAEIEDLARWLGVRVEGA